MLPYASQAAAAFAVDGDSSKNAQWIKLVDPVTSSPFWFHRRFRSRRDEAPAADDDGSRGAWAGEPEAKRFVRCVDESTQQAFYADLAAVTTSWARPPHFDKVGLTLPGALGAPEHPGTDDAMPDFPVDLLVGREYTDGAWWAQKRGGGTHFYSSTAFRKRLLVIRNGVLSYHKNETVSRGCCRQICPCRRFVAPRDLNHFPAACLGTVSQAAKTSHAEGLRLSQYYVNHIRSHVHVTLRPFVELTSGRAAASGVQPSRQFVLRFESGEVADEAASAMGWLPPPASELRVELPASPARALTARQTASPDALDGAGESGSAHAADAPGFAAADGGDDARPGESAQAALLGEPVAATADSERHNSAAPMPPPLHLLPRKPQKPHRQPVRSASGAGDTP